MSSNVLRIIIHWLSARRDVGLTQWSLIPKKHSLYRALKHSIPQHKLDLNLSKTKQPLPIITNSHLNLRYLTASANLTKKCNARAKLFFFLPFQGITYLTFSSPLHLKLLIIYDLLWRVKNRIFSGQIELLLLMASQTFFRLIGSSFVSG